MDLSRGLQSLCGFWGGQVVTRSEEQLFQLLCVLEGGLASTLRTAPLPIIQEELEFCEKLLQTCFSSPTDDSMDR
jgi:hypothetical protein